MKKVNEELKFKCDECAKINTENKTLKTHIQEQDIKIRYLKASMNNARNERKNVEGETTLKVVESPHNLPKQFKCNKCTQYYQETTYI